MTTTVLAACGDLAPPEDATLPEGDLLVLALQAAAPAAPAETFWVSNAREGTRRLTHADAFGTLFAEFWFPRGALASLDGQPLGATDSVRVTLQPLGGRYGLAVSPAGLVFTSTARPRVAFSYGRYGDLSVADGFYGSRASYAEALRLWAEVTPGWWERVSATSGAGADLVDGRVREGGVLVAAAPR